MQLTTAFTIAGALVFGLLGCVHLAYTFFSDRFSPRDATVEAAMKATTPRLTRRTSLWSAWVGFNASHSLGAIAFAAIYLVLAVGHGSVLATSGTLRWLALAVALSYLALAVRYWFRTPLIGIAVGCACFATAAFLGPG